MSSIENPAIATASADNSAEREAVYAVIREQLQQPIILYMKGNPEQPQCGFSNTAVQILDACGVSYATIDILQNPEVRHYLKEFSNWPTFPQLYVKGELVGGSDIMMAMYESGELAALLAECKQ